MNSIFIQYAKQLTGLDFVAEYKFHPVRKWRIDFACIDKKIAVEVEGGRWAKYSRHTTGKGYTADVEKYNNLTVMGWRLIRVFPETLLTQKTCDLINQIKELNGMDNK